MLPTLQAERQLAAIEAAAVPQMTPAGQRETLNKLQAVLGRGQKRERATQSGLAAIGIGVEYVDKVETEEVS